MENYKQEFIEFLVKTQALKFGEFTLKSGRKSPYFVNMGSFCDGESINKLGYFYASALNKSGVDFETVFGPAYKGIPLAVAVASSLQKDFNKNIYYSFNRKEAKDHGEGGNIVGKQMESGEKLIIIDDIITSGKAIREAIDILKPFNPQIVQILVAIDRMERGSQSGQSALVEVKNQFGIETSAIITIKEIINYLHNKEIDGTIYIGDSGLESINKYLEEFGV